jgi:hypothetical protein
MLLMKPILDSDILESEVERVLFELRVQAMQTSFQEFLRQKVEGSDWRDRKRLRDEWLGALHRLLGQIQDWLRQSDPEEVLELVPYKVERVEERLGVYDAPALQIRLNTESADVVPMGRYTHVPPSIRNVAHVQQRQYLHLTDVERYWLNGPVGRVDITNGERRHLLLFSPTDEGDSWYAWISGIAGPNPFDKAGLEAILKDLLS